VAELSRTVAFLPKSLTHYRATFFEALRERLNRDGVAVRVVYGNAMPREATRGDTVSLPWGEFRANRFVPVGRRTIVWQPVLDVSQQARLVVVEQASKLLANYLLLAGQHAGGARVAFWGHGANLQHQGAHRGAEAVKRVVSTRPHWWFAYTEGVRDRVERLGYPPQRITVVQNAIDTLQLREWHRSIGGDSIEAVRERYRLGAGPVAAFVGGLYAEKRLPFLVAAADVIAREIPDFRLLVVGDGPGRHQLEELVRGRAHIRYVGPLFGEEKAAALAAASLMVIPGLVGLTIVDAFALELPLVTTSVDYHSPEIEYLVHEDNGLIVDPPDDPDNYAGTVLQLLRDPERLARLREGCRRDALRYTNEAMVERFATGVLEALEAPLHRQIRRLPGRRPVSGEAVS
jgi:glycosyltransferase involved in cell wall biosynthesis